jgi:Protein of unknown function (DUF2809)
MMPTNCYRVLLTAAFISEVAIAIFVHDDVVRPYIGDSLAVILLYLFLRSFTRLQLISALSLALLLAYAIEIGQYFRLIEILRLDGVPLLGTIAGSHFDWIDFISYTGGALFVLVVEMWHASKLRLKG